MVTATALIVTLDSMPCSLNNLYATIVVKGKQRRVLSGAARAWKDGAALIIRNAGRLQGFDLAPKQPFAVEVVYQAPNVMQFDLDGKSKLLVDALADAFGIDDRYLMDLRQRKQRGPVCVEMQVRMV